MQTLLKIFVLLLLLLNHLQAQDGRFYLGFVSMQMDYREYDRSGVLVDSETSSYSDIVGYELGYIVDFSSSHINFNFLYASGDTKYTGSLLGSNLGYGSYISITNNMVVDVSAIYGGTYTVTSVVDVLYGGGVGYSSWTRTLNVSQEEIYKWPYLEASLGMDFKIMKSLHLEGIVKYQKAISPVMETNFGVDFDLGGTKVNVYEVSFFYEPALNVELYVTWDYKKQTITASDMVYINNTAYYEPDSTAKNQYIKAGFLFHF